MQKLRPVSPLNSVHFDTKQADWEHLPSLGRSFYARDPQKVALELLGKVILRRTGHSIRAGRIVEVEAYLGADDEAAHAAAGETTRNRVLFGPPGRAYVYLSYGLHYCLNISCMPAGRAGCVLFRALEPLEGIDEMARARRLKPSPTRLLCSGPALLCQALEITRDQDNGRDMTLAASGLWIADDGFVTGQVVTTKRVGITKSAEMPLRYYIAGNEFVSGKRA